jgi:hypothetical protein
VRFAHQHGLGLRAAEVWRILAEDVQRVEESIGDVIHQGAPLFNSGICFFVSGAFERAVQFITEAGLADERAGRGESRIRVGGDFGRQILTEPLIPWLQMWHEVDYALGTGRRFSVAEFEIVIEFLERRVSDAAVFLGALHRVMSQITGPENDALRAYTALGPSRIC